jgi:hypothetical protein
LSGATANNASEERFKSTLFDDQGSVGIGTRLTPDQFGAQGAPASTQSDSANDTVAKPIFTSSVARDASNDAVHSDAVAAATLATILATFQTSAPPNVYQAVYNAIYSSPGLENALNAEIATNQIGQFSYDVNSSAGEYQSAQPSNGNVGTVQIGSEFIQPMLGANGSSPNEAQIADFLMHETQHAIDADANSSDLQQGAGTEASAWSNYNADLQALFGSANQSPDALSNLVYDVSNAQLADEGRAAIAGYNAALAYLTQQADANGDLPPTQQDVFNAIGSWQNQVANCSFNEDGSITMNSTNIESVANYFATATPSGDSAANYSEYYVAGDLNVAFQAANKFGETSQLSVNYSSLGLNDSSVSDFVGDEQADAALAASGFDCGGQLQCSIIDSSTNTFNYFF